MKQLLTNNNNHKNHIVKQQDPSLTHLLTSWQTFQLVKKCKRILNYKQIYHANYLTFSRIINITFIQEKSLEKQQKITMHLKLAFICLFNKWLVPNLNS